MSVQTVTIVGGGMAGSEAALQLARRGVPVRLCEMRPVRMTEAHHGDGFAELVCSNSFRGDALSNAVGLIKEEMRRAGGALMRLAVDAAVPAGGALAVDRGVFSRLVTEAIEREPLITVVREEVTALPTDGPVVIATGPLTSPSLADAIVAASGAEQLYFYDSIAPIIDADSIDRSVVFAQSRYDKGGGDDYLNCPLSREEYETFVRRVVEADLAPAREFEEERFFEACLPIEVMARRGVETLRFGPMKPVGLVDPRTGEEPWAVVQLRMEDRAGTAWNMVGFQTRMRWGAQKEIFRSIPGLEEAEFQRFGSVHRNTFIHGPRLLTERLAFRPAEHIRFAGQITGVEGYVESMAIGFVLGILLAGEATGKPVERPPATTALGGICRHVTGEIAADPDAYQPSNVTWSMIPPLPGRKIRAKALRRLALAERALADLEGWLGHLEELDLRLDGFEQRSVDDERAEQEGRREQRREERAERRAAAEREAAEAADRARAAGDPDDEA